MRPQQAGRHFDLIADFVQCGPILPKCRSESAPREAHRHSCAARCGPCCCARRASALTGGTGTECPACGNRFALLIFPSGQPLPSVWKSASYVSVRLLSRNELSINSLRSTNTGFQKKSSKRQLKRAKLTAESFFRSEGASEGETEGPFP